MEDKDKATEHNSAVEENTSNEAGTSSEVKISLLFQRWNVTIITRGIVLFYSIFLFVLFSAVFLLLLEVRAFEADQFDRLNFSLIEEREGKFQFLPSLFPVSWQSAEALLRQMFTLSLSSSVCYVVPSVQVVTVKLMVWPTGSWHVQAQVIKNLIC